MNTKESLTRLVKPDDPDLALPQILDGELGDGEGTRHLVLVLIDGLGWWNLQEYLSYAPTLRRLIKGELRDGVAQKVGEADMARSVFPSTTAAAITSLLTGLAPGAHNMLSYQVFDPEVRKRFNLISFEGYPGVVEQFQPQPTWFERLATRGETSFALGPKKFIGGGLTRAALRGGKYVASESLEVRACDAARVASEGRFTYFYMAEVDHAGHGHGVGSDTWLAALEEADRAVGVLLNELPSGTELIVTADHGMLNTSAEETYDLATNHESRHIVNVSGEGRVLHLRVELQDVAIVARTVEKALAEFSPDSHVFTRAEAKGLFEAYNGVSVSRGDLLGDLVIVSGGSAQVLDSRFFKEQTFHMVGVHGGLSEIEMRVPLLKYRS